MQRGDSAGVRAGTCPRPLARGWHGWLGRSVLARLGALALTAVLVPATAHGDSWNQFRGPTTDGRAATAKLPTEWSEEKNVRWKTEIPGKAWASPVELDGRIWLANATPDGKRLSAVCVDAESGRVLHDVTVFAIEKPAFCHDYNSYASPTPVIEPGRLYVHFGSAGTACLDPATGAVLWKRQDIPCDHHRGPGSSPILCDDLLILVFDGFDVQYVTALDKKTGATVWRTDRSIDYGTDDGDMKKSYCTPTVVDHGGRRQLVCPAAVGTVAYDPRTGKELWKVTHGGYNTAARPLFTHGLVVICTQSGDRMLAVRPDGDGDVTKTHVAWKFGKSTPSRPSQTVVGDHLYMVSDTGIFGAIDVRTGEQAWSERRTGRHSASLVESGGRLYAFDEDGGAIVFAAAPEGFRQVAENRLAAGCMASPAVVGDDLVVRTKTHLYRLGGPAAGGKPAAGDAAQAGGKKQAGGAKQTGGAKQAGGADAATLDTEPGAPMAGADAVRAVRPGASVPAGVEVTLLAAEPVIRNPIGAATDSRGRLWVAENLTYAEKGVLRDGPLSDRVTVLEDADGDGVAERHRVAIDGLVGLTGVAVGHGGVWLACPPRLLFVPGADVAESVVPASAATVVLDGFEVPPRNHHNFMNGLSWGPDGWLYGRCGASAPGDVGPPGAAAETRQPLRGGVWRYHPVRGTFEALCHGTTNPWGHDWNARGDCFFVNTVNGHLWQVIPGGHYVRPHTVDPNPHVYEPIDQHADHFHFDTAKKWTDSRDGKADAYGGGHAHSGCFIVPDEAGWPAALRGRLLTLNLHGRRFNAERFAAEGSATIAGHDPDPLFFDDPWFRGIDIVPLPDRRLAVLDWSDAGECHDHSGVHRSSGRIFAVRFREAGPPDAAAVAGLAADVVHGGEWRARAAIRGLADRHARGEDVAADRRRLAAALADGTAGATPRLRALSGLWCTGGLAEAEVLALCGDADAAVRARGVWLLVDGWPLDTVMSRRGAADVEPSTAALVTLERLARGDTDARVRLAVASALQRLPFARRAGVAAALAARSEDAADHNLPKMVWYAVIPVVEADPAGAVEIWRASRWPDLRRWIARRITEAGQHDPALLERLLAAAAAAGPEPQADLLAGMAAGLRGRHRVAKPAGWDRVHDAVRGLVAADPSAAVMRALDAAERSIDARFGSDRALAALVATARDPHEAAADRGAAIETLVAVEAEGYQSLCRELVAAPGLAAATAAGLARDGDPAHARALVDAYADLAPGERPALLAALVARPTWAMALLDGIERQAIPRSDVTPLLARQIAGLRDEAVRRRLAEVWGQLRESPEENRRQIAAWRGKLGPESLASADRAAGRVVWSRLCASCHRLHGEGGTLGPDLTGAGRHNLDYLLENVIDPSAVVTADYRMRQVLLADGRTLSGVVAARSADRLTLRTPTETHDLATSDIEAVVDSGVSIMPSGQLGQLSEQEVRDLIAYLMTPGQTPLP